MPKRVVGFDLDLTVANISHPVDTGGASLFSVQVSHLDASGAWTTGGGGAVIAIEQTNAVEVSPVAFSSAISINSDSIVSAKDCSTVQYVTARTSTAESGAGFARVLLCFYTPPG